MDNFNVTKDQDEFPDVMLKYRCRIIFTTRSRYENQISPEVREHPSDVLPVLMGKSYDAGRKIGLLEEMIGLLHGHTYAVELAVRLLSNGMLKPQGPFEKAARGKDGDHYLLAIMIGSTRCDWQKNPAI